MILRRYILPYAVIVGGVILSFIFPVWAGEIKITVTGTQGTFEHSYTISDANITRIVNAYRSLYTTVDENGDPVIPTNGQALRSMARGTIEGIVNNAIRWHQEEAAKSAVSGVAPIDATEQ